MEQLFIIAQKRSGSTLLQRILNQIPGFFISGENAGAFISLAEFYERLLMARSHKSTIRVFQEGKTDAKPAWLNPWLDDFERIVNHMRAMMQDMYAVEGATVWGFKEIRYGRFGETYEQFLDHVKFLRVLFPECKFLLLTRELDALIQSNQKRPPEDKQLTMEQLSQAVQLQLEHFKRFSRDNPDNSFLLYYEDILNQTEKFHKELFDFLQVPFAPEYLIPLRKVL